MPQVLVIIYLFTNLIINLVPLFRKNAYIGNPERRPIACEESAHAQCSGRKSGAEPGQENKNHTADQRY